MPQLQSSNGMGGGNGLDIRPQVINQLIVPANAGGVWNSLVPNLQTGLNQCGITAANNFSVALPKAIGSGLTFIMEVNSSFFVSVLVQPSDQISVFGFGVGYAVFPFQRVPFVDSAPNQWDIITNLPLLFPQFVPLTAHSGGGQGSAQALQYGSNVVTIVGALNDSVILPLSVGGCSPVFVSNRGAFPMNVYPPVGVKLCNQAVNIPLSVLSNRSAIFWDVGTGLGGAQADGWDGGMYSLV